MDSYLIVGLAIVGLGILVAAGLVRMARASSRRDRVKRPLDPESLEAMRIAQKESSAVEAQKEMPRFGNGIEF